MCRSHCLYGTLRLPSSKGHPKKNLKIEAKSPGEMCWSILRKECRLVCFLLRHPNSADFAQSPWFGVPVVLLYRFALAAFCFGWLIGSIVHFRRYGPKWLIYLSNWSFSMVTLYFVCATIVTGIHYRKQRKQGQNSVGKPVESGLDDFAGADSRDRRQPSVAVDNRLIRDDANEVAFTVNDNKASHTSPMAWYHQALWVVYNIAAVAAVAVTLVYWVLLFSNKLTAVSVVIHAVNSVVMVGDTMLSSVPVRLFHVIYPMLYLIAYLVFTLIYWAVGGTSSFGNPYIYPMTDYTGRPVFSAVSQLCCFFIGLPLCECLLFGLYQLRVWMKTKCRK